MNQTIEGVRIEDTMFTATGQNSGIITSDGLISTVVWRRQGSSPEYPYYGVHIHADDRLCFISKSNVDPVVVDLYDLREGSVTYGCYQEVICPPSPTKRLVIPRGVAHLVKNVEGLITLNAPKFYWDFNMSLVEESLGVINVSEEDIQGSNPPAYRVCRFPLPQWLYPFALRAIHERYQPAQNAPLVFEAHGYLYELRAAVKNT